MFSFLYHCHDFYRTWLYIWVTRRVSYKKQELPTLRKHLSSSPVFFSFLCCPIMCLYVLVCRSVHVLFTLFVCVCALWCPTQIVFCFSSSCVPYVGSFSGFYIFDFPSVFSNVYFTYCSEPNTPLNWFPSNHLGYLFLISPKTDNMFWKQWKLKDHKIVDPCML
jgi:hypothetical protein